MEAAAPPPPPSSAPASRRIDFGEVLGETFSIYGKHAGVLIGSAIVVFGIAGIIDGFVYDEGGWFLSFVGWVVNLLATAIYVGLVVRVVQHARAGTTATLGETWSSISPVLGVLILNGLLKSIAIGIGFFLLVIPGIFLATIWSVTGPSIVVERSGIIDAFGRSWELVKDDFWTVLGVFVVAYLILAAAFFVAVILGIALGLVGLIIVLIIFVAAAAPVIGVVSAVVFFDLGGGQVAATPATPAAPPPAPAT